MVLRLCQGGGWLVRSSRFIFACAIEARRRVFMEHDWPLPLPSHNSTTALSLVK